MTIFPLAGQYTSYVTYTVTFSKRVQVLLEGTMNIRIKVFCVRGILNMMTFIFYRSLHMITVHEWAAVNYM